MLNRPVPPGGIPGDIRWVFEVYTRGNRAGDARCPRSAAHRTAGGRWRGHRRYSPSGCAFLRVVNIGQGVAQPGPRCNQGGGRFGHAGGITVGGAAGHPSNRHSTQRMPSTSSRAATKVHFRGARVGKTNLDAVVIEGCSASSAPFMALSLSAMSGIGLVPVTASLGHPCQR